MLPGKRLVFRPADALRLDLISVLSLVSALATSRYTDLRADIIALVSVAAVAVRTVLSPTRTLHPLHTWTCVTHVTGTHLPRLLERPRALRLAGEPLHHVETLGAWRQSRAVHRPRSRRAASAESAGGRGDERVERRYGRDKEARAKDRALRI